MNIRKADSKGRVICGVPEKVYAVTNKPDGTIVLTPLITNGEEN